MTTLREAANRVIAEWLAGASIAYMEQGFEDLRKALLAAEKEQEKAYFDLMVYGMSVIKDGKRIDPKTLYIDSKTNTCTDCGKPLGSAGDIHTCSPQVDQ